MEELNKLLKHLQEIADTAYIATMMHWEMDITAPKKSLDYLIDVKTKVELKVFELSTSKEYKYTAIAWQYKPKVKKYVIHTDSLYNIGDWIEIK